MVSDENDDLGQPFDPFAAEEKQMEEEAKQKEEDDSRRARESARTDEEREVAAQKKSDDDAAKTAAAEARNIPPADLSQLKSADLSASKQISGGEQLELEFNGAKPSRIAIAFGWDAPEITGENDEFDMDASAFLLGGGNKVTADSDFVFYNNMTTGGGSIRHHGDRIGDAGNEPFDTGGDVEIIVCHLESVPFSAERIMFAATIHEAYEREQDFTFVKDLYVRVLDLDENRELLRYNLPTEELKQQDAYIVAELERGTNAWVFHAKAETKVGGLYVVAKDFSVYVAPT